ncbi:MAG: 16S rRNA (guanine(527)-N(7))-methyltransferase RsmG [Desulfosarcina sp.]|nr:16S rRNA (guanine(527)-N(7))-methyltransferase RsmG [Desulfosarcina sp.]MBC2743787.1 16S rRNA (guanine(527)-N(7))-methyltransferase RsmG [Desulfosarcina sp.]MBC2766696.1 16S rRNA (guanine(527)-N(7))-methyltransferase RsmG [Desulfosarcina sp.]
MDALLKRCGINLAAAQLKRLWAYHQLLRRHDAELNLTRIRNFENMVVKLYADSILPALHAPLPSPLLDLGTGPGMPGIPLKIFRPDLHILLAESRQNRTDFLKTAVSTLGLSGLDVVKRRIAPDYDRPVAGVITRAVESIADTLVRVAGCIMQDGMVIFMKGPRCDEEIETASQTFSSAYELADDIPYQIPHTPHRRRLVVFRRKVKPIHARGTSLNMKKHRIKVIESENNGIFKDLKKLQGGRGVKKQGKTLVCGARLVAEVMQRSPERCLAWISAGERHPPPPDAPCNLEWVQLAPDLFQILDLFGTRSPIILYDVPTLEPWRSDEGLLSGCSLLIPFQDPENVGAVIRCGAAFDADRIVLLSESANPFHPKAIRTSAGTVFSTRLFHGPSLGAIPEDLPVIALASSGRPLARVSFPESFLLLPGMEGPGLPDRWERDAVAIPMAPGVESLNAAVATAIALYEWRRASAI